MADDVGRARIPIFGDDSPFQRVVQKVKRTVIGAKEVDVDTSDAERKLKRLASLQDRLKSRTDLDPGVKDDAIVRVRRLMRRIRDELKREDPTIKLDLDTGEIFRKAKRQQQLLKTMFGRRTELKIDADMSPLEQAIGRVRIAMQGLDESVKGFNRNVQTLHNLGRFLARTVLLGILGAIGPVIAGFSVLTGGLLAAGAGFGLLAAASAGSIKALIEHEIAEEQLETAMESRADAQQQVRQAETDLERTQRDSAEAVADSAKAYRDSVDEVKDARKESAQSVAESFRAISEAERALKDAEREAAEGVEDAIDTYREAQAERARVEVDARRAVAEAVGELRDSEEELRDTQREAAQAVKEASEAYAEAYKEYRETVRQSQREVAMAAREVSDAEREVRDQQVQYRRDVADANETYKQAVLDLRETEVQARRDVVEAEREYREAIRDRNETEREAMENIAEAREDYRESVESLRETQIEASKDIADALEREREAAERVAKAQADISKARSELRQATQELVSAQRDLNQAMQDEPMRQRENELDLREARLNQAEIAREMSRLETELQEARFMGDTQRAQELELALERARIAQTRGSIDLIETERTLRRERRNGSDELNRARDAVEQLWRAQRDAQLQLDATMDDLKDAQRASAEAAKATRQAQIDAAQSIAEAQERVMEAQQGITRAQREGRRAMIEANRAVVAAYGKMKAAQRDGARAIRAAEKAVADSAVALRRTQTEGRRAIASAVRDLADARYDHKEATRQAKNDIREARIAAVKAHQAIGEAQRQGAKDVEDAAERVKEAHQGVRDAQVQGARDIRAAQKDVEDAYDGIVDARRDGDRAVNDALRNLKSAMRDQRDTVVSANDRIKEAEERRAEAAEEFRKAQVTRDEDVQDARESLIRAERQLAETEEEVQEALEKTGATLTASQERLLAKLKQLGAAYSTAFAPAQRLMDELYIQMIDLAIDAMPALGKAAEKTAEAVTKVFQNLRKEWTSPEQIKIFQDFLDAIPKITATFASALGKWLTGLFNYFELAMPYIQKFFTWLDEQGQKFLDWTQSVEGQKALKEFFEKSLPVIQEVAKGIGAIIAGIFKFSQSPLARDLFTEVAKAMQIVGKAIPYMVWGLAPLWALISAFNALPTAASVAVAGVMGGLILMSVAGGGLLLGLTFAIFKVGYRLKLLPKIMKLVRKSMRADVAVLTRIWSVLSRRIGRVNNQTRLMPVMARGPLSRFGQMTQRRVNAPLLTTVRRMNRINTGWGRIQNTTGRRTSVIRRMLMNNLVSPLARAVKWIDTIPLRVALRGAAMMGVLGKGVSSLGDAVRAQTIRLGNGLERAGKAVGRGLASIGTGLQKASTWVAGLPQRAANALTGLNRAFNRFNAWLGRLSLRLGMFLQDIGAGVGAALKAMGQGIGKFLASVDNAIVGVGRKVLNFLAGKGPVLKALGRFLWFGSRFFTGPAGWILLIGEALIRPFSRMLAYMLFEFWPRLGALVKSIFGPRNMLMAQLKNFEVTLTNMPVFGGLIQRFFNFRDWLEKKLAPNFKSSFLYVGRMMIAGWWEGVMKDARAFWDAVVKFAVNLRDSIFKVFKPGSPSKVMRWLGQMISRGLAVGVEDEMGQVEKVMRSLSEAASTQRFSDQAAQHLQKTRERLRSLMQAMKQEAERDKIRIRLEMSDAHMRLPVPQGTQAEMRRYRADRERRHMMLERDARLEEAIRSSGDKGILKAELLLDGEKVTETVLDIAEARSREDSRSGKTLGLGRY